MRRIGLVASKMAKGNLFLYNFFVILISFLFSLLIFFISGFSVFVALILIYFLTNGVMNMDPESGWFLILKVCIIGLAAVVGVFNVLAVLRNIRLKRS